MGVSGTRVTVWLADYLVTTNTHDNTEHRNKVFCKYSRKLETKSISIDRKKLYKNQIATDKQITDQKVNI